ncbi:hypothetical protein D3C71_1731570 [compost metagenome]
MRTAYRDRIAEAHKLGQHLGTTHDRQRFFTRSDQLRIGLLDRSRNDHDFGITEIVGFVADENLDPLVAKALDVGTVRLVGTLHLVSEIVQHFGDTAHADAADADEMYEADGLGHLHA